MDHTEAQQARKQQQDASQHLHRSLHALHEQEKLDKAQERRASFQKEQDKSGDRVRERKELWDRLDESERHRRSHEALLRHEAAEANRVDYLQGIKEKQAHLQGH
jgi:hypothetical protein